MYNNNNNNNIFVIIMINLINVKIIQYSFCKGISRKNGSGNGKKGERWQN